MKLYESSEDYLERILMLSEKNGVVHSVDIARDMNFAKASVSIAMHKLEDNGYIKFKSNGEIVLTDLGMEVAKSVYERHVILTNLFTSIGVSEEQAKIDACKVEHDISQETFDAIKNAVKKGKENE